MTCLQQLRLFASRTAVLALIALLAILNSCTSTTDLPKNLPDIALNSSPATPPHHMASYDYPFDSSGNYVSAWAAEGERRAGRSPIATNSDQESWKKSHSSRGSSSKSKKSSSTKSKSSSTSKKKSGSDSKPTKTTTKKSSGSTRHVVKSSDTLSGIARKYGTTVSKIKSANGLKSDTIRNGAVLVIPK